MTITSSLGFDPIWSNFNIFGVSAGGAALYSFDSLNPTVPKPIYSDAGLNFPYPNPILFDANGNGPGPFYFSLDSTNPTSLYDLFLYDAQGNLIWNVNDYFPSSGSGGGSITTNINLENLVVNSVMWRHADGTLSVSPSPIAVSTNVTMIAPGANTGLSANINSSQPFGPDIYFIRNGTGATDTIIFTPFTLGPVAAFTAAGDVPPVEYVNFATTGAGTGETYKYFQFPITAKVQNLTNQIMTVSIWAQGVSGTEQILLQIGQFFGDDSTPPVPPFVLFPIQTINLTAAWVKYSFSFTVPNVAGKTLGGCNNDGIFLQVGMPLTTTCNLNFCKPSLYLGNIAPGGDFIDYDQIDGSINTPRTGDTRMTVNNFAPFGWVPMDDGTIGNLTSGATTRARNDTFPLYNLLWNSVNNAWAPVTGGRGANAIADYIAAKPIALIKSLGRVFAGTLNVEISQTITSYVTPNLLLPSATGFNTGVPITFTTTGALPIPLVANTVYYAIFVDATHIAVSLTVGGAAITLSGVMSGVNTVSVTPYSLGQFQGALSQLLATGQLPQHTHNASDTANGFVEGNFGGGGTLGPSGNLVFRNATAGITSYPAAQVATSMLQPTTFLNVFIKL